ncbi:MAG: hypothetical protein ABFD60_07775 [Bryobacteraceae bacterium]
MGIVQGIVGGVLNAVGSFHATRIEKQAAEYEAEKAAISDYLTRQAGASQERDIRKEGRLTLGTQAAQTRASGITMEGSPLEVMADSAAENELQAQRVRYSTEVTVRGYQDIFEMRKYESKMLTRNMFNRAGASFLQGFAGGGGGQAVASMSGGGFGSSLMGS